MIITINGFILSSFLGQIDFSSNNDIPLNCINENNIQMRNNHKNSDSIQTNFENTHFTKGNDCQITNYNESYTHEVISLANSRNHELVMF